jgi:hypothetical protein
MRLDRSLGDVQIFSDFRVVTSLKKQIDDLPFPGSYVAELLFHKHRTLPIRPSRCKWLNNQIPRHIWIRVFVSHFAFTRPNRAGVVN